MGATTCDISVPSMVKSDSCVLTASLICLSVTGLNVSLRYPWPKKISYDLRSTPARSSYLRRTPGTLAALAGNEASATCSSLAAVGRGRVFSVITVIWITSVQCLKN